MTRGPAARHLAGVLAAPLLWFAHFFAIYIVNALGCARGLWQARWAGLPLSSWLIVAVSVLVLLLMGWLWRRTRRALRARGAADFLGWLAGALAALSALAVVWETWPALWVQACGPAL